MDGGADKYCPSASSIFVPESFCNVIIPQSPRTPNCINLCQDGLLKLFCCVFESDRNGYKLPFPQEVTSKSPAGLFPNAVMVALVHSLPYWNTFDAPKFPAKVFSVGALQSQMGKQFYLFFRDYVLISLCL